MIQSDKILDYIYKHGYITLSVMILLAVILNFLIKNLNKKDYSDSKKALIVTLYSFLSLLLLLFFIRFWPPTNKTEELIALGGGGGGMTVNFGDTDMGKGDNYLSETLEVNMQQEQASEQEEANPEDILTQDNTGASVTTPPKSKIKHDPKKPTNNNTQVVTKAPVKKTISALDKIRNAKNKSGDGNSDKDGNQGKPNGDPYSKNYDGDGGKGNKPGPGEGENKGFDKKGYSLAGRRLAYIPPIDNNCNQAGRVTIEVAVDKSGKVVSANNAKGSTADACLLALAKKYAMQTKWQPSDSGANKQTGTITYNFSF